MVNNRQLHAWALSPKEAVRLQQALRSQVITGGTVRPLRWLTGVDVAYTGGGGQARAAVVVCRWPGMDVIEERVVEKPVRFPYVPGLLSFREAPIALAALSGLTHPIDCLLVDGQGRAHPRRFGLACHLGLWIDRPTIGCAKSKLYGEVPSPPGVEKGAWEPVRDVDGEVVGAAVTTRDRCKPLYVSVGHRVS
ncbi:MAG: endonuclease V, partial [Nitrospinota bacterium]